MAIHASNPGAGTGEGRRKQEKLTLQSWAAFILGVAYIVHSAPIGLGLWGLSRGRECLLRSCPPALRESLSVWRLPLASSSST